MLQQTQTSRVERLLPAFLARFPNFTALAGATLAEVLIQWQGFGYNRRAKYLQAAAQTIHETFADNLPADQAILTSLPGIGPNTAASILAYAYNLPTVFVETNIRTVFIYHFFDDWTEPVPEPAIRTLVADSLDHQQSREWYWALMDYGVHLKQTVGNLNRRAKAYGKQSAFQGSLRQARGAIIRALSAQPHAPAAAELAKQLVELDDSRYQTALASLVKEGLVVAEAGGLYLAGQQRLKKTQ